jgi:hypothetical protein
MMTLKTRKKHKNQSKDTQDCPRLDACLSRQSSRQGNTSVQPGNLSGAGSDGGGDEYAITGESRPSRGSRQGGSGNY